MEKYAKVKVAYITNIPTPYRKTQWEYFADSGEFELSIYYCASTVEGRLWNTGSAEGVKEYFLKGIRYKGFHFNPGIIAVIRKKFDVFVVGGYGYPTVMLAILLLRLFRKRYIMVIDGVSPQTIDKNQDKLITRLRRFFMAGASAYSANGTIGKLFCKNLGIPEDKIYNQFMTVDVDDFISREMEGSQERIKLRNRLGINENTIVALYCGRLVKHKGVQDFIKAVGEIRSEGLNIIALLVGDGIYRCELEQQAANYPGSTLFVGHVAPVELYKLYYSSDIFVFPTRFDPWGLVVNEAMACELPIITTTAAGCHLDLVIDGQNGYVVNHSDSRELAGALKKLSTTDLRQRFGEESRRIIMQWTYKQSAKKFRKMVQNIT